MLVLSRKTGERIQIGNDVKITVVAVKGKRVRLGIEAPDHCRIVRDEVLWADDLIEEDVDELELTAC